MYTCVNPVRDTATLAWRRCSSSTALTMPMPALKLQWNPQMANSQVATSHGISHQSMQLHSFKPP